jgi:FixJ family two-component response regulator
MPNATVHVVDDDPGVLRAISRKLQSYHYQVLAYTSAEKFLEHEVQSTAACLVLDLQVPEIGLELQGLLNKEDSYLPVIFVSGDADVASSVRAMKAGAVDFLTKPFSDVELVSAVQAALDRSRQVQEARLLLTGDRNAFATLTSREREVCLGIAQGLLNKQVGFELGTTEKTVKAQRARVMQKLGATSLADVVRLVERLRVAGEIIPSPASGPSIHHRDIANGCNPE